MKGLKLFILVFVFFLVVGCEEGTTKHERRLEVVESSLQEHFYIETFELSMIMLRYIDEEGRAHVVALEESMVIGDVPLFEGSQRLWVQYEGLQLEIWIYFVHEPMIQCLIDYRAYDGLRDLGLPDAITKEYFVPESVGHCTVEEFVPWTIQGYEFSHFEPSIGETFPFGGMHAVSVIYVPEVLDISFYDHHGNLIEVINAYHGDDLTHYTYDFPYYFFFYGWDQNLNFITKTMDVHPYGDMQSFSVTFMGPEDHVIDVRVVYHGETVEPPEAPAIERYKHVGWDKSLDYITRNMTVRAIYEFDYAIDDFFDDVYSNQNYTASITWENIPYEDGYAENIFKVDGTYVHAYAWGEDYYLVREGEEVFIIIKDEFDDYENWYKHEFTGETVEEMLIIDLYSIDDSQFSYKDGVYTLTSPYYETLFGNNHEDVLNVTLTIEESTLIIFIEWTMGVTSEIKVYDVDETEVILPEYIDET